MPWEVEGPSLTGEAFYPLGWKEGSSVVRGTIENKAPTPDGNNYINFRIPLTENTAVHQLKNRSYLNFGMAEDSIIYLAYMHNAKSVDGSDIWRESGQSASKTIGLDFSGTRWSNGFGHWDECDYGTGQTTYAKNQDHYYTVQFGNPSYHINQYVETSVGPNLHGYSCANPVQLSYGEWHYFVFAIKLSATGANGFVKLWVDGVQTHEYLNINTVEAGQSSPYQFKYIELIGTTAQPYNDHPVHDRMLDKIILTDNWQDIISAGYLVDQNSSNNSCTEAWTCSAWSAWSTCTNNTQSRTKTCTDSKNCGTTNTKLITTETQSCTSITTYNLTRFTQLVTDWLKTISSSPADVNKDGKVNSQDLGIMMSNWQ